MSEQTQPTIRDVTANEEEARKCEVDLDLTGNCFVDEHGYRLDPRQVTLDGDPLVIPEGIEFRPRGR